ncbi:TetR/AcrR family transcriptional regulator [Rhodococcus rhodnii]|nr:TetR family transcriptional regulator [Rhodococcus rhodnii]
MSSAEDRTARARIRDAAVEVFGREGFSASVRTIAARAGVSPGLVIHHFGSKEGLRQACDDRIDALMADKIATVSGPGEMGPAVLAYLSDTDTLGGVYLYAIRSIQAGGQLAHGLYDRLTRATRRYLETGVANGSIRPGADEDARAAYLVRHSLGIMLTDFLLHPPAPDDGTAEIVQGYLARNAAPVVELFTFGMLTDTTLYDDVLKHFPPTGGTS